MPQKTEHVLKLLFVIKTILESSTSFSTGQISFLQSEITVSNLFLGQYCHLEAKCRHRTKTHNFFRGQLEPLSSTIRLSGDWGSFPVNNKFSMMTFQSQRAKFETIRFYTPKHLKNCYKTNRLITTTLKETQVIGHEYYVLTAGEVGGYHNIG